MRGRPWRAIQSCQPQSSTHWGSAVNPAMRTAILLIAALLAVTHTTASPPSAGGVTDNSLLYSLLQVAGFSDRCVSGVLDTCSSPRDQVHFPSLIQEVQALKTEIQGAKAEVQEVKEMVQQLMVVVLKKESRPRHCMDLLNSGDRGRGIRTVYPYSDRPHHPVAVYCDQIIDGGGWTVFQRRINNKVRENFDRNWMEYEKGFGNLNGEFWLGLDVLNQLTTSNQNQELRIDLADFEGGQRWAKYATFQVGSADTNYRLTVGRYSGNAGDSLTFHNGLQFTTRDADHDRAAGNCADERRGGWWYNACHQANLNGYQYVGASSPRHNGIMWYQWRGDKYSLRRTTMMVRPVL